jgi:hypothetical protein
VNKLTSKITNIVLSNLGNNEKAVFIPSSIKEFVLDDKNRLHPCHADNIHHQKPHLLKNTLYSNNINRRIKSIINLYLICHGIAVKKNSRKRVYCRYLTQSGAIIIKQLNIIIYGQIPE